MGVFFFFSFFAPHACIPHTYMDTRHATCIQQVSKAVQLRNLGQRGRNMLAKAGESDRAIRVKMVRCSILFCSWASLLPGSASAFFRFLLGVNTVLWRLILPDFSRNISSLGSGKGGRPTADKNHWDLLAATMLLLLYLSFSIP